MSEFVITLSQNQIVDRLRRLQSDLIDRNDHDDAVLVEIAIQALTSSKSDLANLIETMRGAFDAGAFDTQLENAVRRRAAAQMGRA